MPIPLHSRFGPLSAVFASWFALLAGASAAVSFHPAEGGRWAFQTGVAFITSNTIDDLMNGRARIDDGPAGGEIYALTASRHLGDFHWQFGGFMFRPQLEMPLTLEVVDERGRSPFPSFHGSLALRWNDFPWNESLRTSFTTGVGLAYWTKILAMDKQRHSHRERSRVKFNWPIQLSLALPDRPDDQLILFILHQSGGHVFDQGGVNSIGFGYRRDF